MNSDRVAPHLRPVRPASVAPAELEAERRRQGLSIAEVARRSGLPPSTVRFALHPGANPTLSTLHALAAALGRELMLAPATPPRRRRWLRRPRAVAA